MTGLTAREQELLELLAEDPNFTVAYAAEKFGVSHVTVRNTLRSLEEKGFAIRSHGGAFPAIHPNILHRKRANAETKDLLAKEAASYIKDEQNIMIVNGTTSANVAKYLMGKSNLHVVSNSMLVLPYFRANPAIHLTVVGGNFEPHSESLVGPITIEELDQFRVDVTISGTDGFSLEHGLTTSFLENAEVVRKMIGQAKKNILVAESSKYNRTGFVKIVPMNRIDIVITDSGLSDEATAELVDAGIEVIRV